MKTRKTTLKKAVWKKMGSNIARTTYAKIGSKIGTVGVVSMQRYPSGKGYAWGIYSRGNSNYCKTKAEALKKIKAYMRKN